MQDQHVRLFIPGPVEVRPEVLEAQTNWMIGHRSQESYDLYARCQAMLRRSFMTEHRVYLSASSGTGLMEAASRNAVRDDRPVLHCVNGAFSSRWAEISRANGKQVDTIEVEWGQPITPELVTDALSNKSYDAVTITYNETSTGVLSPLADIAATVREVSDETLILVDAVSAYMGAPVEFDGWGLDVVLSSSQKALALPPGIAVAAVSDRTLERAKSVPHRGYYFDFLTLEKYLVKDQTPATPAISLMYALERQLADILDGEGLEARFARHSELGEMTRDWAAGRGFEMFAAAGYESPTVTAIKNGPDFDSAALNAFLHERSMVVSRGYGKLKESSFRIAHMGDVTGEDMQHLFDAIDSYMEG
jgi:predicted phosphoserine aminotransferase